MNPLAQVLAGLVDPRLEGAACAGHHDLFDARDDHEPREHHTQRVALARTICGTCPVLDACHHAAQSLKRSQRTGVWAGRYYDLQGRPHTGEDTPR